MAVEFYQNFLGFSEKCIIEEEIYRKFNSESDDLVSIQSKLWMADLQERDQTIWTLSKSGQLQCAEIWNEIRKK
jgi:hypothetical protein